MTSPTAKKKSTPKKVKPGRLLTLETGEYSDHNIHGFFVAIKEVDFDAELEAYFAENPEQREGYSGNSYQFVAWLIARGNLVEVDYTPIHVGSYGCLEIT